MVENLVMNYEQVQFESEGATLRGRLYRPANGAPAELHLLTRTELARNS